MSYLGYRNEELEKVSNYLPLILLISGTIEGRRKGYKRKRR
ncbi:hypothetical protein [Thermococcus piezophilus]|nr:hypothetical protein [Thermococcus piezophilus]